MPRRADPSSPDPAAQPELADACRVAGRLWGLWVLFVIYGSLVPLDFHALPLAEAWSRFQQAPMLQIGMQGRADWVANLVLYVPVGFLGLAWGQAPGRAGPGWHIGRGLGHLAFGCALAVAVEFTQVFFPPRTVSLNDILAECLGTGLGALLAVFGARPFLALVAGLGTQGGASLRRMLAPAYLLGFVSLALFPYDFLLSAQEWSLKLQSGQVAWLLADAGGPGGLLRALAKLLVETAAVMPLGAWWASSRGLRAGQATPVDLRPAWAWGLALGLAVELAQLSIVSGVSQGASVLTRGIGFAAGAALAGRWAGVQVQTLRTALHRLTLPLVLVYLPLLTLHFGWWQGRWMAIEEALGRLQDVRFVPLYYHYFSSEAGALVSLLSVAVAYAPVGLLGWAWQVGPRASALSAATLAMVMESGRLMVDSTKPDPSNLLIAAAAAWLAHRMARLLSGPSRTSARRPDAIRAQRPAWPAGPPWRWLLPLAVGMVVAVWLVSFPVARPLLAIAMLAAAAGVAWRPALLLVLVPAALPVLDLAPWSGRRLVDEFDLWVLLLLSVAWARVPAAPQRPVGRALVLAFTLLMACLAVGAGRALWPWPADDWVDPGNPLSPLNALRLAKGAVWAWGLWLMARRLQAGATDVGAAFGWGMVAGLAGTVAAIVVERLAFSHLLDFSSDYRIAGPFSVMSLGGAYVECYLAVATPFLLARLLPPAPRWRLLPGGMLLAGAAYALMVTFSRGGYAAMALAVGLMLIAPVLDRHRRWQRLAVTTALAAVAAGVCYPVLMGSFAQSRLKTVSADLDIRERHWAESLNLLAGDPVRQWLGVGLGRYAEANFWAGPQGERAGGHRLVVDDTHGPVLRLGAGEAYYVDQIVPVQAGSRYLLSYSVRFEGKRDSLSVSLCQKWLITSIDCTSGSPLAPNAAPPSGAVAPPPAGTWQTVELAIAAPPSGEGVLPRPVRLSLYNSGGSPVSVDRISLVAADGEELVRNGSFTAGMDHWTFTSDHHLAWHAKSMPVGLTVELGLPGAAAALALVLAGLWGAGAAAWRGQHDGLAFLAALCAFMTVGLIDTLVDVPRFLQLWLLLCLLPSTLPAPAADPGRPAAPRGVRPVRDSQPR